MNKIDMSCVVGSQVLCEFWDDGDEQFSQVGMLSPLTDKTPIMMAFNDNGMGLKSFDNCRIYQHPDYWIANVDGELVLPDGLVVIIAMRDGYYHSGFVIDNIVFVTSDEFTLKHSDSYLDNDDDIIAVQVIGTTDGWEY